MTIQTIRSRAGVVEIWWRGLGLTLPMLVLSACSSSLNSATEKEGGERKPFAEVHYSLTSQEWPNDALVVTNSIQLGQRGKFEGNVSVVRSTNLPLAHAAEASLEIDSLITGTLRADTLFLDVGSKITGSAQYNAKSGMGNILGGSVVPLSLPLSLVLPGLPTFTAGTVAVSLTSNETRTLAAGSFGAVNLAQGVGSGTTLLKLSGGTYAFSDLTLGTNSRLECLAECEVRVLGRVQVGARSYLGSAATTGVGPGNVRLLVKGGNSTAAPGATPAACNLDNDATLAAWALVPNGTLRLGQRVAFRGKAVAKDASIGVDSSGLGLELPLLVSGPVDVSVRERQAATFVATASGSAFTYQWQKDGVNIAGATGATLTLVNAAVADDGKRFRVVLTNAAGSVVSAGAKLTVIPCQARDTLCDGVDEDCDGAVDEDFAPRCAAKARVVCVAGHETQVTCDNGQVCDGSETCVAGMCASGPVGGLDDGNMCTSDSCDSAANSVKHTPQPGSCFTASLSNGVCDNEGQCVVGPIPYVSCVDASGGGLLSARFGYLSESSVDVAWPSDSLNALSPGVVASLPQVFHPGTVEGAFRASFAVGTALTWRLGTHQAVADLTYPPCELQPSARVRVVGERPGETFALALGQLKRYAAEPGQYFNSNGFSNFGGSLPDPSFIPSEMPYGPTHVEVRVTEADEVGGGSCGHLDAIANIAGLGEGRRRVNECEFPFPGCQQKDEVSNGGMVIQTADVAAGVAPISLRLRAMQNFTFGCLGDAREVLDQTVQLDPSVPSTTFPQNLFSEVSGLLIYKALSTRLPTTVPTVAPIKLCATWNANFIDEVPGTSSTYPASFAEFRFRAQGPLAAVNLGADYDEFGNRVSGTPVYLDAKGCVNPASFDARALAFNPATPGSKLQADFRVRTEFATSDGRGISVRVGEPTRSHQAISLAQLPAYKAAISASPRLVLAYTTNNKLFVTDTWDTTTDGWRVPPATVSYQSPVSLPAVQGAAMASQFMSRGNLGMSRSDYVIVVNEEGLRTVRRIPDPERSCTTDTDCSGAVNERCVTAAGGAKSCGCSTQADCSGPRGKLDAEAVCNPDPVVGGRCYWVQHDSAFDADLGALFLGPASITEGLPTCTASGMDQCPDGQDCYTITGMPCSGPNCYCRRPDHTRWRSIVSHEFGHHLQFTETGSSPTKGYSFECDTQTGCTDASGMKVDFLSDPPGVGKDCSCAHVDAANQSHCLQSLEHMERAQSEGFGHFVAAAVANPTPGPCTFMYYKEVRLPSCPAGVSPGQCVSILECPPPAMPGCTPVQVAVKVKPPVAVTCEQADRWRNTRCGAMPGRANEPLSELGVERDWLQFFRAWNTGATNPAVNAPLSEILAVQQHVCDPCLNKATGTNFPNCMTARCDNQGFSWAPQPAPLVVADNPATPLDEAKKSQEAYKNWLNERSYRDGVNDYYLGLVANGDFNAQLRRVHFTDRARDRGVDESTTP